METSISILQAVGMLQVLKSVAEAKEKLSEGEEDTMHSRLKHEAEFLYYLWNLIDEEEVECREIKEII